MSAIASLPQLSPESRDVDARDPRSPAPVREDARANGDDDDNNVHKKRDDEPSSFDAIALAQAMHGSAMHGSAMHGSAHDRGRAALQPASSVLLDATALAKAAELAGSHSASAAHGAHGNAAQLLDALTSALANGTNGTGASASAAQAKNALAEKAAQLTSSSGANGANGANGAGANGAGPNGAGANGAGANGAGANGAGADGAASAGAGAGTQAHGHNGNGAGGGGAGGAGGGGAGGDAGADGHGGERHNGAEGMSALAMGGDAMANVNGSSTQAAATSAHGGAEARFAEAMARAEALLTDPGLSAVLRAHDARVAVETSAGQLLVAVHAKDGVADVQLSGAAAASLSAARPELVKALASEGMSLGQFDTRADGGGARDGRRDAEERSSVNGVNAPSTNAGIARAMTPAATPHRRGVVA